MKIMGRTGNASVSSSKPNVVNIGALYTFNSVIGRSAKPGIEAAVDDVNSNSTVLAGMKLNLILHDTNCSGFLGTVEETYHPWILAHTESTLKTLASKPKMDNHVRLTSRKLTARHAVELERNKVVTSSSLSDDSMLAFSSNNSTKKTEDDNYGFVDALAMKISRMRISEPKRSRLCVPASPIQQECPSNIKVNNL
ncbi:unnamed protein product [Camellia sinensis]